MVVFKSKYIGNQNKDKTNKTTGNKVDARNWCNQILSPKTSFDSFLEEKNPLFISLEKQRLRERQTDKRAE